jgi:hypothetical protein
MLSPHHTLVRKPLRCPLNGDRRNELANSSIPSDLYLLDADGRSLPDRLVRTWWMQFSMPGLSAPWSPPPRVSIPVRKYSKTGCSGFVSVWILFIFVYAGTCSSARVLSLEIKTYCGSPVSPRTVAPTLRAKLPLALPPQRCTI